MSQFLQNVDLTKIAIVKYKELTPQNVGFKEKKIGTDHYEIIQYAKQRLEWKLEYTNVVKEILPSQFKMSQLQAMYEVIIGKKYDKRNFQKKIFSLKILKET
jgi:8-oxo-dGTP diphosphatase